MAKKPSSSGRNTDRPNGKSFKKNPRKPRKTGRTINGYKPEKIEARRIKRENIVGSED
jgi:hypothetical protein